MTAEELEALIDVRLSPLPEGGVEAWATDGWVAYDRHRAADVRLILARCCDSLNGRCDDTGAVRAPRRADFDTDALFMLATLLHHVDGWHCAQNVEEAARPMTSTERATSQPSLEWPLRRSLSEAAR